MNQYNVGKYTLGLREKGFSEALVLNIIMNNSHDTVYFKDKDSKYILSSKAHSMQFGYEDPTEIIGKSDADFFPKEFAGAARADEITIMETGQPIIGKIEKWEKENGSSVWFSASKYPFFNEEGEILGTWGTSKNITSIKEAEENLAKVNEKLEKANKQLKMQSNIDVLSGLFNRKRFIEVITEMQALYLNKIDKDSRETFCILMLDIDSFKEINDSHGHPVGDLAIKHVAELILGNLRSKDYSFRYGGDEFAVILSDIKPDMAFHLAERLRVAIEKTPLRVDTLEIIVTVSIGVVAYEKDNTVEDLLKEVDSKLYQSKEKGKNRVT